MILWFGAGPCRSMNVQGVSIVQHLNDLYLTDFTKFTAGFTNDRLRRVSTANVDCLSRYRVDQGYRAPLATRRGMLALDPIL
jgi:diphthamide biosynthesis methyltransferase